MWLEVASTNKQPEVIASFFLKTVEQIKGLPTRIRSDDGTEISIIEPMQIAMRAVHDDEYSGEASFCVGTSPANQNRVLLVAIDKRKTVMVASLLF